jgi:hypothetical protein
MRSMSLCKEEGRAKVRGEYGFSSLLKQNKKGKNFAVFCFAGKRKIFLFIYEVITWGKRKKSSANYYSH